MDLCEASKMGDFTPGGLLSVSKLVIYEELKSEQKNRHTYKSWPLVKNPQFLSNPYETSHEAIIFTKFHED